MKRLFQLLLATALAAAPTVVADSYTTDANMSPQKDEGTIDVRDRISRLLNQDGRASQELIAEPRIRSSPGVPGSLYVGLQPAHPDFAVKENFSVDMSWPYPMETGTAFCSVTIKRGDTIVSKSRLQLQIEGPGRAPLVLLTEEIDPISAKVGEGGTNLKTFVLLEFARKPKEEVKKLAIENYGNPVRIRDSDGHELDGGRAFGKYNDMGLALDCGSEAQAERVAGMLRGETTK
jgi:hypothetical protein